MKKTAEETIIEKVGDFWWTCENHKLDFLAAMEEYASQSFPPISEEEIMIKDLREKLFGMRFTKYNIRNGCAFTKEYIDGWSQCINELLKWSSRLLQREPVGKTDKLEVEQPEEKKEFNGCDSPLQTNE